MNDLTLDELLALRDAAIDGSTADALWHWDSNRREILTAAVRKLRARIREQVPMDNR